MKKILLSAALAVATFTAHAAEEQRSFPAEVWVVKASFTENPAQSAGPAGTVAHLARVPVMEFMVHLNECQKGISRLFKTGAGHMQMEQQVCIQKDPRTNQVAARGWLVTPEIIRNVQRPNGSRADIAGLDYAQSFDIQTNGTFVATKFGAYDVEMTRVFPSSTAMLR